MRKMTATFSHPWRHQHTCHLSSVCYKTLIRNYQLHTFHKWKICAQTIQTCALMQNRSTCASGAFCAELCVIFPIDPRVKKEAGDRRGNSNPKPKNYSHFSQPLIRLDASLSLLSTATPIFHYLKYSWATHCITKGKLCKVTVYVYKYKLCDYLEHGVLCLS